MTDNSMKGLEKLPTWRVVMLMLTSASAALSALYLIGAVLFGLPGLVVTIVVFCSCAFAVAMLKPPKA